jgi:hypothetical protein
MNAEGDRSVPLPDDLPVIERSAVRLVVLDAQGLLLLSTNTTSIIPISARGGNCPAAA